MYVYYNFILVISFHSTKGLNLKSLNEIFMFISLILGTHIQQEYFHPKPVFFGRLILIIHALI